MKCPASCSCIIFAILILSYPQFDLGGLCLAVSISKLNIKTHNIFEHKKQHTLSMFATGKNLNGLKLADRVISSSIFFFLNFIWGHQFFLCGHWYACFGFWWCLGMTLKPRADPLACVCFVACMQWVSQIHPWCCTCWAPRGKHGDPVGFGSKYLHKISGWSFKKWSE